MLEERRLYFESCNIKENEILKDRLGQEYFFIDKVKIWVPEIYFNTKTWYNEMVRKRTAIL